MEMRLGYWLDIFHFPSRHWSQDRKIAGNWNSALEFFVTIWVYQNFWVCYGFFPILPPRLVFSRRPWEIGLGYAGLYVFPDARSSMREWEFSWESFPAIVGGVAKSLEVLGGKVVCAR